MYLSWNSVFIVSVIEINPEWRFKVCASCVGITWDYFNKWVLHRDNGIHLFCIRVSNLENKWLKHEIAGESERVWKLVRSPCFKCLIAFCWLCLFSCVRVQTWNRQCMDRLPDVPVLLLPTVFIVYVWAFLLPPLQSSLFIMLILRCGLSLGGVTEWLWVWSCNLMIVGADVWPSECGYHTHNHWVTLGHVTYAIAGVGVWASACGDGHVT